MKEGHHIETGVENDPENSKDWTYYAKFVNTSTGEVCAQISGLKITKMRQWIKGFK